MKTRKHAKRRPLGHFEQLEARQLLAADFRAINGFGNNEMNPSWGANDAQLVRLTSINYADGVSEPRGGADGSGLPNPRAISNQVVAQEESIENDRGLTSFLFQWGQFLDHDLSLTEEHLPPDPFIIPVPDNDPEMFPGGFIPLFRSRFDESTGTSLENPRQQINQITSFIDGSVVYGSDAERAWELRSGQAGLLKSTSEATGEFMPYNTIGLHNAAPPPFAPDEYFLAGDIRANEQPGLTSMHTLFVREHNRLAREIAEREFAGEDLTDSAIDEEIYQRAREIVGALVQSITYNEFLPALLGPSGISSYTGYDPTANPSVANIFSAALYRVGHTMLPNDLMRLNDDGSSVAAGPIGLAESFFDPTIVVNEGIEPFLKGLSIQPAQEIDAHVNDGVRNMLFDPPAQFDLAAINIQRAREHGLPSYTQARQDLGLAPYHFFSQITDDRSTIRDLRRAYGGRIDQIDVWLGAISESHIPGGSVGELMQTVLVDQFERSRDGDRYYYENILEGDLLRDVHNTRLSDIILRNTRLETMQPEAFRAPDTMVYRADVDKPANLTVQVADGELQVLDADSGEVLQSQAVETASTLVLFGSNQADTITIESSIGRYRAPVEIHGGGGEDRLQIIGSNHFDLVRINVGEVLYNANRIYFGNFESIEVDARGGNDFLDGVFSNVPLILAGGNGNDFLRGSHHNDLLLGQAGADVLFGYRGNDLLVGGSGLDFMLGGAGDDILVGGGGWNFMLGGGGRDLIYRGSFPDTDELTDPLWTAALASWFDSLEKYLGLS